MSDENVSLPVAQALASALAKIEAYVPTEYVDNSEPDLDAEHLNHAEQGIMRVTNLLNAAVDVIQGQESRVVDAENKIGTAALTGGMTDLSSGVNSLYSSLTRKQLIATASTTDHDIKSFISASINGGKLSYSIVTILNSVNTSFFGESGNFIILVAGDNANYGFFATNLWNGKLWTGRFSTYADDWNLYYIK